jgi:rubrerythrin
MSFKSVDEILDFAISKEEASAQFYAGLAKRMERPAMREVFVEFTREEIKHKTKLMDIKEGKALQPAQEKVMDLKVADYVVDVEPGPGMDFEDALILAMKMEKAAFRLYTDLSQSTNDPSLRSTLEALAQEEARHKLRFELEYDQHVQQEN